MDQREIPRANPIGADFGGRNGAITDISALKGRQITQGTNTKGVQYNRNIEFEDGYDELARIVAGLGKEVKRINQCLTKAGAIEYANKRRNWTAHEADITGPDGEPDGVKEVFVCDSTGKVKVINGVGLAKSTFPLRKAYFTAYPTRDDRKGVPFTQFRKELTKIADGTDSEGNPVYSMDVAATLGDEFKGIRKEITPFDLYKQYVFNPVYDSLKEAFKQNGVPHLTQAHIYNKALRTGFNNHVKQQILAQLLGADPDDVSKYILQKTLKSEDYIQASRAKIMEILKPDSELFQACQGEVEELINQTTDELMTEKNSEFQRIQSPPRPKVKSSFTTPPRSKWLRNLE